MHLLSCDAASFLNAVLRKADDGNERDGLKGSSTACVVLIDTVQVGHFQACYK